MHGFEQRAVTLPTGVRTYFSAGVAKCARPSISRFMLSDRLLIGLVVVGPLGVAALLGPGAGLIAAVAILWVIGLAVLMAAALTPSPEDETRQQTTSPHDPFEPADRATAARIDERSRLLGPSHSPALHASIAEAGLPLRLCIELADGR